MLVPWAFVELEHSAVLERSAVLVAYTFHLESSNKGLDSETGFAEVKGATTELYRLRSNEAEIHKHHTYYLNAEWRC